MAKLVVVTSRIAAGMTLAVVDTLAGEIRAGMLLVANDTGEQWEVRSIAFAPIQSVARGRQGILLAPIGHQGELTIGVRLEQTPAIVAGPTV